MKNSWKYVYVMRAFPGNEFHSHRGRLKRLRQSLMELFTINKSRQAEREFLLKIHFSRSNGFRLLFMHRRFPASPAEFPFKWSKCVHKRLFENFHWRVWSKTHGNQKPSLIFSVKTSCLLVAQFEQFYVDVSYYCFCHQQ